MLNIRQYLRHMRYCPDTRHITWNFARTQEHRRNSYPSPEILRHHSPHFLYLLRPCFHKLWHRTNEGLQQALELMPPRSPAPDRRTVLGESTICCGQIQSSEYLPHPLMNPFWVKTLVVILTSWLEQAPPEALGLHNCSWSESKPRREG